MKSILKIGFLLLLSTPSLLTIYLWGRSTTQTDDISQYSPGRMTRFRSSGGGFWFETRPWEPNTIAKLDWQVFPDRALYPFAAGRDDPWYQRWGILWNTHDYDLLLAAPYSLLLLLSIPFPLWWIWRLTRRPASQTQASPSSS